MRYRGEDKPKNLDDLAERFEWWKAGRGPDDFEVVVWGLGRIGRRNPRVQSLSLGTMGKVKLYGDRRTTLCDIDSKRAPTLERIHRLFRCLHVRPDWIRLDRSHSGRWHLIVRWRRAWSPLEIVAIQAMLGSDYKREMTNLYRLRSGTKSKRWNFLFEEKLECLN